ncbi:MAG: glutamate racemase [Candidatus Paceibacterota bacterium]|jgi:glutamate racemase
MKKNIGVFDSGFGGINILRGIVKALPEYNYIYLGDTARTPYGTRSTDVVYEFTRQAVDFLLLNNCELIILACNTASSDALRKIQQEYLPEKYPSKRVLGVLIPAAEEAMQQTRNKRIGVIATEGTVKSGAFVRELTKLDKEVKVFQQACPLLVPIVESGEDRAIFTKQILEKYLNPLKTKNIDTLILGCTHYGILEKQIKNIMGRKVQIISEASIIPKKLKEYFAQHPEIESKLARDGGCKFYSTDLTEKFTRLGSRFFGKKILAEKVELK